VAAAVAASEAQARAKALRQDADRGYLTDAGRRTSILWPRRTDGPKGGGSAIGPATPPSLDTQLTGHGLARLAAVRGWRKTLAGGRRIGAWPPPTHPICASVLWERGEGGRGRDGSRASRSHGYEAADYIGIRISGRPGAASRPCATRKESGGTATCFLYGLPPPDLARGAWPTRGPPFAGHGSHSQCSPPEGSGKGTPARISLSWASRSEHGRRSCSRVFQFHLLGARRGEQGGGSAIATLFPRIAGGGDPGLVRLWPLAGSAKTGRFRGWAWVGANSESTSRRVRERG